MRSLLVRDLMLPLENYPKVALSGTIKDAFMAIREAKLSRVSRMQPPRAVLVMDEGGNITGQLGHLDFLRALEPRYRHLADFDRLAKSWLTPEMTDSVLEMFNWFREDFSEVCLKAGEVKVSEIMRPISESVRPDDALQSAIHAFVVWQSPRLMVIEEGKVVGVIRLADVFDLLGKEIMRV